MIAVEQRLCEALSYDHVTGRITWRVTLSNRAVAGKVAGAQRKGYCRLRVDGRDYFAHRVAWLLMTGAWPIGQIDHQDGNIRNNAWENLRDVSPRMNSQNQRRAHSRNPTGLLGASFHSVRKCYVAQITVLGTRVWLGSYTTAIAAHAAYVSAKRKLHEGNTL